MKELDPTQGYEPGRTRIKRAERELQLELIVTGARLEEEQLQEEYEAHRQISKTAKRGMRVTSHHRKVEP